MFCSVLFCSVLTCSRPQRTATGGLEPGTSRPKVLGFTTAPIRSTYGLDALTLSKSEVQKLNQFHKKFLKQVMHLQERKADFAVYLLSGQLPLVADLHKRILGTLGSVRRSSSIEREIAERQIILKDHKSKSRFVYVN